MKGRQQTPLGAKKNRFPLVRGPTDGQGVFGETGSPSPGKRCTELPCASGLVRKSVPVRVRPGEFGNKNRLSLLRVPLGLAVHKKNPDETGRQKKKTGRFVKTESSTADPDFPGPTKAVFSALR